MDKKRYKIGPGTISVIGIDQYNEIKAAFLNKNQAKSSLFRKFHKLYNIDKYTFKAILNEIYDEYQHPSSPVSHHVKSKRKYSSTKNEYLIGYNSHQFYKNPPKTDVIPRQHNN